ncbi:helix-loop-helix DNA-binding domain-containing protein [Hirsutella rhossiliensis]|uniref:Helix-loop-helix DNA-binding domain-containing protein n=1 Tax=Hirsutella rhossiliensis TaxID=111463 RepID=A0A9P8SES2_9HYPO|nr:helix-loop-helix DNA-binding domain-containing protein [Hirsutella rhossiliensis]KAH0958670.1 helix-loop-helix DNA-binding domain-containing protein [Hirsutella rhossiliensis]
MEDNAGCTQQSAAAMDQSPSMVSPALTSHQPSVHQQHVTATSASTPASSSRMSTTFEFSSAPSDDSMPSFDPTIAAFTDMSFTQPSVPSTSLQDRGSFTPVSRQPQCFRRADLGSHDKKRIKVDPETPALDSIDYWIRFDDDFDKMGSFEIDYSKRNDPTGQNGPGTATSTMPGLGSGLYSTAMAPFREEDFIDDAAFDEQVLSDDEDMLDAAHAGDRPPDTGNRHQHPDSAPAPLPPPQPEKGMPSSMPMAWASRPQPGLRLNPALEETPRQMRRDIWGGIPRGMNLVLSPEEQRHLLEIALNSGQMPASFIPPNGFGIGFGAGLGQAMVPGPSSQPDESQEPAALKDLPRRPAAPRCGSSKKPSGHAATDTSKPRSADRIAHNDVERKYRTNLKVKIAELRDAVPALQSPVPGTEAAEGPGQQGGPKVSKGTVLTKATEYIQQLEQRNKAIMLEHQQLARRLQAFETLFNSASRQPDLMPNPSMTLFDPRGFC